MFVYFGLGFRSSPCMTAATVLHYLRGMIDMSFLGSAFRSLYSWMRINESFSLDLLMATGVLSQLPPQGHQIKDRRPFG